jgi:beta-glucosidase
MNKPMSPHLPQTHHHPKAREIVQKMTLEEKASLLAGVDDWHLRGVERLGIKGARVTDCGHGVTLVGEDAVPATCFPTGVGMASTWNTELLERAGRALGRETRALGCSVLLGPKLNLHRHPLNGRNFETFSEDPWLAGLLGAAEIRGIQSSGVGACVKVISANNQQKDQGVNSSEVDERTLRELYLRPFELAHRLGRPCSIMTSYNRLNGEVTAESRWLLTDLVKKEWNFSGFIVSDWRAVHTAKVYASGLDLEMPGPGKFLHPQGVLQALKDGLMQEDELDDKALRLVSALLSYAQSDDKGEWNTPEHRALALDVAQESIVLLKNDRDLLPLDPKKLRSVLVVGPNAASARLGGGGSASVTPPYSISPLQGIREILGDSVDVRHTEGCGIAGEMEPVSDHFHHTDKAGARHPGLWADFFNTPEPQGEAAASWSVPHLDFSWGWATPGAGVQRGTFSVRFQGTLTAPASGEFRFGIHAQQGSVRVFFNDQLVVDEWDPEDDDNFEAKYQDRQALFSRTLALGEQVKVEIIYSKRAARAGIRLEWEIPGAPSPVEKAANMAASADIVILCIGLSNMLEGGSHDRADMELPPIQHRLIEAVTRANPRTVAVLFNGGPLTLPWADRVPAIFEAWYPGQEGGRALARLLFGMESPSGRLPDTIPYRLEDHASIRNYPGDGHRVHYEEGLSVGYRHFDTAGIEPHFPFGFGLGYTTFRISPPQLSKKTIQKGETLTARVTVENLGHRPGKEVVQWYVSHLDPILPRPPRELRGFHKIEIAPGEKATVTLTLDSTTFESFDPGTHTWRVQPGRYEIHAGSHSRSLQSCALLIEA